MIGKKPNDSAEYSALVIKQTSMKAFDHSSKTLEKPRVLFDHCHKPQHTRETCWKVHGKPANWKCSKGRKFPPIHLECKCW